LEIAADKQVILNLLPGETAPDIESFFSKTAVVIQNGQPRRSWIGGAGITPSMMLAGKRRPISGESVTPYKP